VVHPKSQPQRLIDARGRTLIERRGVRGSSLGNDAYHFLRTASWTRIVALFATIFVLSNILFGTILYVAHANVMNAHGYMDYVWFSVQTMATIGYGYLAPADHFANAIVTIESFFGIILTALITGVFFARFSTPRARVLFSKVAVIADFDGKRTLQFRLANERSTAIVEATVHVYLTRNEKLAHGETMRRVYDLELRRNTTPVFALSMLAQHTIDEKSPLYGVTPDALTASATNIVVTFTGIDDLLAATVHSRYLYSASDIRFEHRFIDLFRTDESGRTYMDFEPFHETHPLIQ